VASSPVRGVCHVVATSEQASGRGDPRWSGGSGDWAGSGHSSQRGSRRADTRSHIAATSEQATARGRPVPCRDRLRVKIDVIPVYRDLHQFPKGKSGAVLNVKRAETEGSCYVAASNPVNGHVPVP